MDLFLNLSLSKEITRKIHVYKQQQCVSAFHPVSPLPCPAQARRALADRQKDLEVKSQQLELKLSNKTEEDIKKARRKSTQAGQDKACGCVLVVARGCWLKPGGGFWL